MRPTRIEPGVTAESLQRAKDHQRDERRALAQASGVIIDDDGRVILPGNRDSLDSAKIEDPQ